MALVALDGPGKKERVYDAKFIGYLGATPISDFDLGGISLSEFTNSGRTSVANAIATKKNPTANLQALISHIDSEIQKPSFKGFSASYVNEAIKELQQWENHSAASSAQTQQIANLIDQLQGLKTKGAAIGYAPIPGLPTSIPNNSTPNVQLSPYIWKGIDTTQSTPRVFFYFDTPMGVFQSKGTPQAQETAATDTNDMASIFNQVFSSINSWIADNGYAGSGNVQNAENSTGVTKMNLASFSNDGYGGYFTGLNTYGNFINLITNPNFVVHNPSTNLLKQIGKDVSTAAKAVTHVVQQVANAAVQVAKTVEKVVATVAAAPARAAALAAIRSNFEGVATQLAAAYNKDSTKVGNMWSALGGTPSDLFAAIKQGGGTLNGPRRIGAGGKPTALQTVAVPVMKAIFAFLATMGIPVPASLQQAVENAIGGALNKANPPAGVKITTLPVASNSSAGIVSSSSSISPVVLGLGAVGLIGTFILLSSHKKKK